MTYWVISPHFWWVSSHHFLMKGDKFAQLVIIFSPLGCAHYCPHRCSLRGRAHITADQWAAGQDCNSALPLLWTDSEDPLSWRSFIHKKKHKRNMFTIRVQIRFRKVQTLIWFDGCWVPRSQHFWPLMWAFFKKPAGMDSLGGSLCWKWKYIEHYQHAEGFRVSNCTLALINVCIRGIW